ncbi:RNA polymerase sigma-70 factor (ECF subfamily) [Chitinophaga skermanii]|uniref:RNA polymerase sigma factor n=1 Tax=Chitinophaga skermanii TaxID=331697 RepID=A0A327QNY3_9BACT|nr:sigma-70 family RNA polymerase sigma factor [Chitinophaga skermanii]RAJ05404.1 RNA polymerase sigma-70 factor (ECF subfamily) [Chitinophaga skermanii]
MQHRKFHTNEDELLAQAKMGNQVAIKALVTTYSELALTLAMNVVSSREDAEEIVQDAFLKAFGALQDFKQSSKFSTWLYSIVYRTALNALEGKKRIQSDVLDPGAYEIPGELESWDTIRATERKAYVQQALSRLGAEDRLVVQLFYMADKTIPEICTITGFKKSAVKMRLLRSRQQLATTFQLILPNETKDLL